MTQSIATRAAAAAEWVSVSASAAGFAPDPEALLDKAITEKRVGNFHGVVIVRHGGLVLERYFEGEDDARGSPLGNVVFNPRHTARSALGIEEHHRAALRYRVYRRKGAAAGGAFVCVLPRIH
jgi:hypothetical protein